MRAKTLYFDSIENIHVTSCTVKPAT